MALLLACGGCARSYDGTITPAYSPVVVEQGWRTHVELRRNRPEPPAHRHAESFPPVPPLVRDAVARRRPPPRHDVRNDILPSGYPLRCTPQQVAGGRHRVICR